MSESVSEGAVRQELSFFLRFNFGFRQEMSREKEWEWVEKRL